LLFAVAFRKSPLFYSAQNTYLLNGLAGSGAGLLKGDWLVQATDPFPLFSALVCFTIRYFDENALYFLHMGMGALFLFSLSGIVCAVTDIGRSARRYFFFFSLFTLFYYGLSKLPGMWRFEDFLDPLHGLLTSGESMQAIFKPFLLPATFGVFIFLSIFLFLQRKEVSAVVFLIIAPLFHSSYLLSAGVLTGAYVLMIALQDRDFRKASLLGLLALVMISPVLWYVLTYFSPTSAELTAQAQDIIVHRRMPHHAVVSCWFGWTTVFKLVWVSAAVWLVRRTRLFLILLLPLLASVVLTVIQILSDSNGLALLFPWRMSTFLVPVASLVILVKGISTLLHFLEERISCFPKLLVSVTIGMVVFLGCAGLHRIGMLLDLPRLGSGEVTDYVSQTARPGDLYLIPPDFHAFRMTAQVPVFVDEKSHPYNDAEVIEWFSRLQAAKKFYKADGDEACGLLENLIAEYGITYVLFHNESVVPQCDMLQEVCRDSTFSIYAVALQ